MQHIHNILSIYWAEICCGHSWVAGYIYMFPIAGQTDGLNRWPGVLKAKKSQNFFKFFNIKKKF